MGKLVGSTGQYTGAETVFDASGTITTGGTAQLLLPKAMSRSSLIIENISDTNMLFDFGAARVSATLTSGAVSSCSVVNAGFGYSRPPKVIFLGGALGARGNPMATPTYTLQGLPDWAAPNRPAQAHCVMSGNAPNQTIGSIVMDDPGLGYAYPPYVYLLNDPLDPYGCAAPSATVGVLLLPNGGAYTPNGTVCTTDQISVFCASSGKAFTCKYTI